MGTFFEEQARGLIHAGHKAGIIYPELLPFRNLFQEREQPLKSYDDNGLPTYISYIQMLLPGKLKQDYNQFSQAVDKIFLDYVHVYGSPDVIHAHSVFYAGIAAWYIAKKYNIPFVITEHLTSYVMGTITNPVDIKYAREIFRQADRSLIVSDCFRRDLARVLEIDKSTFQVVPNMVNNLFFENRLQKDYQRDEQFVLFTNSFLLPRKNHLLIFNAIKKLRDQQKNVFLLVGGEGELRDTLIERVKKLKIENHVKFLGGLNREQVKKYVDESHAFVLTSFYETFGVVLIESLAAGRPVITTNSGGPEDFINKKNGILLSDFTPDSLTEAIDTMMINYQKYNQDEISEECRRRFSEKTVISMLEQVYTEVLAEYPRATQ